MKQWGLRTLLICTILLFSVSALGYQDLDRTQINLYVEPDIRVETESDIGVNEWHLGEFHSAGEQGVFNGNPGEKRWAHSGAITITANTEVIVKFTAQYPINERQKMPNMEYLISHNFVEDKIVEGEIIEYNVDAWEVSKYYILAQATIPDDTFLLKSGKYEGKIEITVSPR